MHSYLKSTIAQFKYYKHLGDSTFLQVSDSYLFFQENDDTNSLATIVKHMSGNMVSRWTDFLTSDGEKEFRNRDKEFFNDISSREEMIAVWEEGWKCLFDAIEFLESKDLEKIIYIRNQGHTVIEAINRQLAHYAYHVGQIVYVGKLYTKGSWNSLSIPRNQSKQYNKEKFNQDKRKEHFTKEFLPDNDN